jgi:hypothetical protein
MLKTPGTLIQHYPSAGPLETNFWFTDEGIAL